MNGIVLPSGTTAAQQEGLQGKQILRKTCYGLDLISHIVLLDHPVPEGLRVSFPDCGYWPNPFDGYRSTLHVMVIKEDPNAKLSDYIARYHDESGTIPDGDAIDFAGHFWGIQGQPLLEKINRDLYLRIGETFNFYDRPGPAHVDTPSAEVPDTLDDLPEADPETTPEPSGNEPSVTTAPPVFVSEPQKFSFYKRPIKNKVPCREITLQQLHTYLTSDYAKANTERLRSIEDEDAAKAFKQMNFDYVTPAGIFSYRKADKIVTPSGLIVLDIDHLKDADEVEATFQLLLNNPRLETQLLFRSPSGHGLKWIIEIVNNEGHDHKYYFQAVENYLRTYGIVVDPSGKDISRACFVPYDPAAFIHPKYLKK